MSCIWGPLLEEVDWSAHDTFASIEGLFNLDTALLHKRNQLVTSELTHSISPFVDTNRLQLLLFDVRLLLEGL